MMLLKPLVRIFVPEGESGLMYAGVLKSAGAGEAVLSSMPLFFLIAMVTAISVITIFIYKKRVLQMRITVYNMILMIGILVLGYYYASQGAKELSGEIKLLFYSVMPVISFILSLLAWRGIRRDYLMLKAVERLR